MGAVFYLMHSKTINLEPYKRGSTVLERWVYIRVFPCVFAYGHPVPRVHNRREYRTAINTYRKCLQRVTRLECLALALTTWITCAWSKSHVTLQRHFHCRILSFIMNSCQYFMLSPQYHHYWALASSVDHESLPYHESWGHYHAKVQHLVIALQKKRNSPSVQ